MKQFHFMRRAAAVLAAAAVHGAFAGSAAGQQAPDGSHSYTVFIQSRPIGQEVVAIVREGSGWVIRGGSRLGPPIDIIIRRVLEGPQ